MRVPHCGLPFGTAKIESVPVLTTMKNHLAPRPLQKQLVIGELAGPLHIMPFPCAVQDHCAIGLSVFQKDVTVPLLITGDTKLGALAAILKFDVTDARVFWRFQIPVARKPMLMAASTKGEREKPGGTHRHLRRRHCRYLITLA